MNKVHPFRSRTFHKAIPPGNVASKIGIVLSLIFCLLLLSGIGSAQTVTSGQLSGNVVDQNGAVIPDATVTVRSVDTGAVRTVTTSADGNYTVANLPIGTYRVTVNKTGFKETSVTGVQVNVSNVTRQNVTLEVGEVSQVVEVTADAIQVETQTGAVGEVITGEQVRELPLNGRSFVQLTQLQPGVSAANNFDAKNKGLFAGVDFSVNGNSAQSNLFLTDGANNNDTGSNRTILLYPSIEAIAEFKMLRNSYGPEYGQAAGSVISIATRGGSNDFHGSLFYFGRNDALNSTEFFAKRNNLEKDKLRRNDFGFSIGGPIVKERLFFFLSTEWNKELRGQARFGRVPTQAERTGDFRESLTRATCALPPIGNGRPGEATQVIPQAQISPGGLLLAQLYPLPNRAFDGNCYNWAESPSSPIDFREWNVRIDYNFNDKHQFFGRYTDDNWTNASPILLGAGLWGDDAFPGVESSWAQPSRQAAFKLTSTLSGTAVNEVQFAYSANRINIDPGIGGDLNASINQNVPGIFPDANKVNGVNRPHPVFWGGIQPFTSGTGPDLWTQAPFRNSLDIYSIRDDFSKVWGNHTMKMGFLWDRARKIEDSGPNNETPQFWGACCSNNSGNYLADILTQGSFFGFSENDVQAVGDAHYTNLEFYFGDTWKARPNLTVELGARYSIYFEPYDGDDEISSFLPQYYDPTRPASDPCNGLVVPKGTNPCAGIAGASTPVEFSNRSLRENNFSNIAPRLGVAWDVFGNGKTAIRAGFGQFFLRERTSPVFAGLALNPPFVRNIGGQRTLDGQTAGLGAASNGAPSISFSPEAKTPYSLQFNVSVGQQLWEGAAIEIGYVGNRARNQLTHYNINTVLPQNRVAAAFADPNDGNAVNALRPYSNFGAIHQFARAGRANYNSLQFLFRTRFLKNSQFQAAYTFSRSQADFGLTDSSGGASSWAVLDPDNPDSSFSNSDINRPHIFVANLIYNMPSLKGSNPFVKAIAGGWELATILQFSSGTSLSPILNAQGIRNSNGVAFAGGIAGLGTSVQNQRPIRVEGEPCTISSPDGIQTFNPNAFTLVGYRIGETIPQRGTCLGPPTKNVDFSLYKNFNPSWLTKSFLGEGARIQFRLEFFNLFDTVQFRGDSVQVVYYDGNIVCGNDPNVPCSPTNNVITSSGVNGNFGQAGRTRGGREVQYALKLIF
ncbi:MAG: carboxypeptidase regulatory-like domain-containing protein [Pyrinomonadaceae bacterium]